MSQRNFDIYETKKKENFSFKFLIKISLKIEFK